MLQLLVLVFTLAVVFVGGPSARAEEAWKTEILKGQIKAFCIDFNWGPKGVNGFAGPGHWGDADPAAHVAWDYVKCETGNVTPEK